MFFGGASVPFYTSLSPMLGSIESVFAAAREGQWDPVCDALRGGFPALATSAVSNDGRTLLHLAAAGGDVATTTLALQAKRGSPDYRDRTGCTPLWYAAQRGTVACLALLLRAGGDPNARCGPALGSLTPLTALVVHAAGTAPADAEGPEEGPGTNGDVLDRVALLLSLLAVDVAAVGEDGLTAHQLAVRCGRRDLASAIAKEVGVVARGYYQSLITPIAWTTTREVRGLSPSLQGIGPGAGMRARLFTPASTLIMFLFRCLRPLH